VEPVRSYVICCVQRTGSWLLAHTLADTGYAGRPSDYFGDEEREPNTREWGLPDGDLAAYIRAVRDKATTPNGVLGSKMMWNVFDSLRSSLRPPAGTEPGLEFMRTTFPDPQFIWLRRADKVRQGISWWRAAVTDQWALRPGQQADQPAPDLEQMGQLVRAVVRGRLAAVVHGNRNPALPGRLRGSCTRQARRHEPGPGVPAPPAARSRRPSACPLPQTGRQPDRPLRGPHPLSNERPWLSHTLGEPRDALDRIRGRPRAHYRSAQVQLSEQQTRIHSQVLHRMTPLPDVLNRDPANR